MISSTNSRGAQNTYVGSYRAINSSLVRVESIAPWSNSSTPLREPPCRNKSNLRDAQPLRSRPEIKGSISASLKYPPNETTPLANTVSAEMLYLKAKV